MESGHQDNLGTPREPLPRAASEGLRAAPQPLHTAPEAAQLGQMTQLAQYIVQQARETASTLEKNAQDTLAQAKADARELFRKAEQQTSEAVREARFYAEAVLNDAKKLAQQERDLADSWALQIRTAAKAEADALRTASKAEAEAQRKQSQEEQAIEKRELERLQRLVSDLRAEASAAYEHAMKARATIDAAARAEFELRTKELTNLHTVVQTTTDLAKQVIKPSEPKTSTTEVVGTVVTQFIQSAQSVFEKAIDRSPGVQQLVGEMALRGHQAIAGATQGQAAAEAGPGAGEAAPSATAAQAGGSAPERPAATPERSPQDDVDLELLRVAQTLTPEQIPLEVLQRVCQARYQHTDLTKMTFRDFHAAAFLYLDEQRKAGSVQ